MVNSQTNNKIRSVDDLIESIEHSNFFRGQIIFRGHSNYNWELQPSLLRLNEKEARTLEAAYIKTLLIGQQMPYVNTNDPLVLLMNLQHFGAPTRLLDWTYDPLIALFFACYDKSEKMENVDGNIYFVQKNLYNRFDIDSTKNKFYKQKITEVNFKDIIIDRLNINKIFIVDPMIKNPRLRVQVGCFMFFPFMNLSSEKGQFITLLRFNTLRNEWLKKNTEEGDKYFIANKLVCKDCKKSILNELSEKYGISEKTIFVESKYMKECESIYLEIFEEAKKTAKTIPFS